MADENETPEETPEAVEAEASDAATVEAEAGATADAAPAAPPEPTDPKERRRHRRSRRGDGVRPTRTPEERAAARAEERQRKALARRTQRAKARAKRAASAGEHGQGTPPREHGEGRPKARTGVVVSDRADKTIVVRIDIARAHRRYQKIVRSSTTLHAHDEANQAHAGDTVRIVESRPLSRTKRWRLVEVLERAR